MILPFVLAVEETAHVAEVADHAEATGLQALGISSSAFIIQLITFIFVFLLLKKFAFTPIVRLLEERRKTIDDGVRMGLKMEKAKAEHEAKIAQELRKARDEGDKVIAGAHKESREIIREAEKTAKRKADSLLSDAEVRLKEEEKRAKQKLEKDIVGLVSDATEAIVGEKVNLKKDSKLIEETLKKRKKQ